MNLDHHRYERLLEADQPLVNIGGGDDLLIRELNECVRRVVGFEGQVVWDPAKPVGTLRKLLDVSRLTALGWKPSTTLDHGIARAYRDFLARTSNA